MPLVVAVVALAVVEVVVLVRPWVWPWVLVAGFLPGGFVLCTGAGSLAGKLGLLMLRSVDALVGPLGGPSQTSFAPSNPNAHGLSGLPAAA